MMTRCSIIIILMLSNLTVHPVTSSGFACPLLNIDYVGSYIANVQVANWRYCGELCIMWSICTVWTYAEANSTCILKAGGQRLQRVNRFISGEKGCI